MDQPTEETDIGVLANKKDPGVVGLKILEFCVYVSPLLGGDSPSSCTAMVVLDGFGAKSFGKFCWVGKVQLCALDVLHDMVVK